MGTALCNNSLAHTRIKYWERADFANSHISSSDLVWAMKFTVGSSKTTHLKYISSSAACFLPNAPPASLTAPPPPPPFPAPLPSSPSFIRGIDRHRLHKRENCLLLYLEIETAPWIDMHKLSNSLSCASMFVWSMSCCTAPESLQLKAQRMDNNPERKTGAITQGHI